MNNLNPADSLRAADNLTEARGHDATGSHLDKLRIDSDFQRAADKVTPGADANADGATPDRSLAQKKQLDEGYASINEQYREAAATKLANDEVPVHDAQSNASNRIAYKRALYESNSDYPHLPQFPDITPKQKEQLAVAIAQNDLENIPGHTALAQELRKGDTALAKELREADRQLERLRLGLKGKGPTAAEKLLLEQNGIR